MEPLIRVSTTPLDPAQVEDLVAAPGDGAHVLFGGAVRDRNRGRSVRGIRYEAYVAMATRVLVEIAAETEARFAVSTVAVHHRLGDLQVGDLAVVVAVGAPHRQAAFAACHHVIDELKARAPIWKKEIYTDGEAWISPNP